MAPGSYDFSMPSGMTRETYQRFSGGGDDLQ
jgi:hypothetical protein